MKKIDLNFKQSAIKALKKYKRESNLDEFLNQLPIELLDQLMYLATTEFGRQFQRLEKEKEKIKLITIPDLLSIELNAVPEESTEKTPVNIFGLALSAVANTVVHEKESLKTHWKIMSLVARLRHRLEERVAPDGKKVFILLSEDEYRDKIEGERARREEARAYSKDAQDRLNIEIENYGGLEMYLDHEIGPVLVSI